MKIIGMLDDKEKLVPFVKPVKVNQLGNSAYCRDGICWATKDQYGDWVCPNSLKFGIKHRMAVEL